MSAAARGSAAVEYVGAVVAVGLLMLALVAVREHRPRRTPPIDPVGRVAAPLRPPPRPPVDRVAPPHPPHPPVRRRRRPRPPRPAVLTPAWAVGW